MALLYQAAEAMGADEIGAWAYGNDPTPEAPHAEHLRVLEERLGLFADVYALASPLDYRYSIPAVTREIGYMADGEAPVVLKKALKDANRSTTRRQALHMARALEWVQFLSRSNKRKGDCYRAVSDAYGGYYEGVKGGWRERVDAILGEAAIRRIDLAAERIPHDMQFETEEEGRSALKADGRAYQDFLAEQFDAVREKGKRKSHSRRN